MESTYVTALDALVSGGSKEGLSQIHRIEAFATLCAAVGVLAVILDLSLYFVRGTSLLKLRHGSNSFLFLIVWGAGAAIMGGVGHTVNVLQSTLLAAAAVGFGWPTLFTKWMRQMAEEERENELEQTPTFEEGGA